MDEIEFFLNSQKNSRKPTNQILEFCDTNHITQGSQIPGTGKVEGCMSVIVEVEEWGLMLQRIWSFCLGREGSGGLVVMSSQQWKHAWC